MQRISQRAWHLWGWARFPGSSLQQIRDHHFPARLVAERNWQGLLYIWLAVSARRASRSRPLLPCVQRSPGLVERRQ